MSILSEEVETPEQAAKLSQRMFQIEIPEETNLEPVTGISTAGFFTKVLYRNDKTEGPATAWLHVDRFPAAFTVNKPQFWSMAKSNARDSGPGRQIRETETTTIEWYIEDDVRKVRHREFFKNIEKPSDDDNPDETQTAVDPSEVDTTETRFLNYYTVFDHEQFTYSLTLVYDPVEFALSETDVQAMFESFQAVED